MGGSCDSGLADLAGEFSLAGKPLVLFTLMPAFLQARRRCFSCHKHREYRIDNNEKSSQRKAINKVMRCRRTPSSARFCLFFGSDV